MIKKVLILGFLISLLQTIIYFIFVKLFYFCEIYFLQKEQRQITNSIIPYVILIFFEIVLIQNILCSIINKKTFTWIMYSLSVLFLVAPFLKSFSFWQSLPFCLITIFLLLGYYFAQPIYQKRFS